MFQPPVTILRRIKSTVHAPYSRNNEVEIGGVYKSLVAPNIETKGVRNISLMESRYTQRR